MFRLSLPVLLFALVLSGCTPAPTTTTTPAPTPASTPASQPTAAAPAATTPAAPAAVTGTQPPAAAVSYTCPMHPQIVQDHPGKCPICGMDLIKK